MISCNYLALTTSAVKVIQYIFTREDVIQVVHNFQSINELRSPQFYFKQQ